MRSILVIVLALAALGAKEPSTATAAGDDSKLAIPFERNQLASGLEVLLHQDNRLPLVSVDIWYHVGALHEQPRRTGFAHLFEHMMFQGSAHVRDDSHFRILESLGASETNGSTSFDRTNYYETVPANHLETALWLESDRMGFLLNDLTPEKLANQRQVVQNERRQGRETAPYGLAEERHWQALFPSPHPYYGAIIGSMADLDAATLDDVKAFFRAWYAPHNATLVVSGNFEMATCKALVEKYFGSLPTVPKPAAPRVEKVRIESQVVLRHDEKIGTLPQVRIGWLTPAFFAPGDATADLLASILAAGRASLLDKRLVRELELAQSVAAYQRSTGAQSTFQIEITGRPGVDPQRLLAETDAVLEQVRQGKITDAALKRAVNRYETNFMRQIETVGGLAEILQTYNHFVGDPGYLKQDVARYRAVTLQDLTHFATDELAANRRVVLFAVPTGSAAKEVQP